MLSLLAVIGFDRYVLEEKIAVLGRPRYTSMASAGRL
jgi:hypothetical protein